MAVEYFVAKSEIQEAVWTLVGKQHPDLANLNKGELVVVFRDKASKTGGQVVLGSSRKAPPLMNALAEGDYKFILEVAQDQWLELTTSQQEALLDHLLCSCSVEEDPKSGRFKFQIRKPDVMAFRENVERYGMWFPKEEVEDPETEDNPVADMFGE